MIYGYVRVSTREQNEDRQLDALEDAGLLDPEKPFRWRSIEMLEKQQTLWGGIF